jgi:hypothetical protein
MLASWALRAIAVASALGGYSARHCLAVASSSSRRCRPRVTRPSTDIDADTTTRGRAPSVPDIVTTPFAEDNAMPSYQRVPTGVDGFLAAETDRNRMGRGVSPRVFSALDGERERVSGTRS